MAGKTVFEAPKAAPLHSQAVSRRTLLKGALATGGLLFGTGTAPSIAQGRRDLRIGLFGGDFGNICPLLRADIQGGIVTRNIFDPMTEIDYASRSIVPFVAEAWKVVDPHTWRIKLREGIKWQKGYGEVTAEDLVYTWQFHKDFEELPDGQRTFDAGVDHAGRQIRRRSENHHSVRRFSRHQHGVRRLYRLGQGAPRDGRPGVQRHADRQWSVHDRVKARRRDRARPQPRLLAAGAAEARSADLPRRPRRDHPWSRRS